MTEKLSPQQAYYLRNKAKVNAKAKIWKKNNRAKCTIAARSWRRRNPEKVRAANQRSWVKNGERYGEHHKKYSFRYRYGIAWAEYCEIRIRQNNRCASCQETLEDGRGMAHLDHDHSTDIPRGILCSRCNAIVGAIEDRRCRKAIEYIINHGGNLRHLFEGLPL